MFEEHVFMCESTFSKRVKVNLNTRDIITPHNAACYESAKRGVRVQCMARGRPRRDRDRNHKTIR